MAMADALFTSLGADQFTPTGYSRGPWSPDALHGGPVAALVARQAEKLLATTFDGAYLPTRFTLDLERPVPLAPLSVTATLVRPGRKVQVAEVTVSDEQGRRLACATVLAIRKHPLTLPDDLVVPDDSVPPSASSLRLDGDGWKFPTADLAYHQDATTHALARGSVTEPGPVTDWIELVVPVVEGDEPSPLQRVVAAADFLNGVSWTLPGTEWMFINPDLTVTLHRLPAGTRIAVDAVTRIDPDGTGTAEADLYDAQGRLGRAVQTLLVERR